MNYTVISKRPTSFNYVEWTLINGQYFPKGEGILIHGGAGVVGGIDRDSGRAMMERGIAVPEGIATVLDEATYNRLANMDKFKHDLRRGIVKVLRGEIREQSRIDSETHDMLENENIPNRPYDANDIEAAGGVIKRDGSIEITDAYEDIAQVRKENAGQMSYVKKRNAETRKAKAYERRSRKK